MSDYTISQDQLDNIYLVENDGNKDVKEDVFLTYNEAFTEMQSRIAQQKRTTLTVYDSSKDVVEVKAQPK